MRFGIRELVFRHTDGGLAGHHLDLRLQEGVHAPPAELADIADIRACSRTCNTATAGIDDLSRKINELQKAIDFFASKLPAAKEMDKVLTEVSQMADVDALQSKTVKSLKTERGSAYSEQSIQMNLAGDFNGFYSFLLQLAEKLPRITVIRAENMSLPRNRTATVRCRRRCSSHLL